MQQPHGDSNPDRTEYAADSACAGVSAFDAAAKSAFRRQIWGFRGRLCTGTGVSLKRPAMHPATTRDTRNSS